MENSVMTSLKSLFADLYQGCPDCNESIEIIVSERMLLLINKEMEREMKDAGLTIIDANPSFIKDPKKGMTLVGMDRGLQRTIKFSHNGE